MKNFNLKKIGFIFITLLTSLILLLLILELLLRFFPVRSGYSLQNVDDTNPVARYIANENFVWSNQWNFQNINEGRINNDGFVNGREYTNNDTRPLVAIIGDEQIEARTLPYEKTLQGILYHKKRRDYRVYSFGIIDAPLSQYLILAQHTSQKYNPEKLIFFLTGNDYDNCFPQHYMRHGYYQFFRQDDGSYDLVRMLDYQQGFLGFFLRHSNLIRYIMFNLAREKLLNKAKQFMAMYTIRRTYPDFKYSGQIRGHHDSTDFSQKSLDRAFKAFDLFLDMLPQYTNVKKENILFILDGHWDLGAHKSYYSLVSRYANRQLEKRGYNHIDMTPVFQRHTNSNSGLLRIENDSNYNDKAHAIMAQEVLKSKFLD